ncbi:polycystic kidney disease 1-like 2 [Brachionus plicatilis]|uniref:Polycystic kidney disease 1-like 2 n=1 Tax=Brachionus plicatilis TaxID=10195 RepID=A0A3M7R8G4_BRAPC|nr:polycystic kidney disease 1-like 2 [Brachionus plicatilis]
MNDFRGSVLHYSQLLNIFLNQAIDILCKNQEYPLNYEINCTAEVFSQSTTDKFEIVGITEQLSLTKAKLKSHYGDFDRTLGNNSMTSTSLIGMFIPTNTEFMFDTKITGFELFALDEGSIHIQIVFFESCETKDTCSSLLINNMESIENFKINKSFSINANFGYNKILFDPENYYPVRKGQMVFIKTTKMNQIAIDKSAKYSYYFLSDSKLAKLSFSFYFNVLIDSSYYFYSQAFVIPFNKKFNFDITEKIDDYVITRYFNISKKQYLDVFCRNSNRTLNNQINCTIMAASINFVDNLSIENNSQEIFTNKSISHYGTKLSNISIFSMQSSSYCGNFILPNTEFKFDSLLNGFELYTTKNGSLNITIIYFDLKPWNDSSSNLILNSKVLPAYQKMYTFSYDLDSGYNRLNLDYSIEIKRGSMILIETFDENLLCIDSSNNFLYSDYFVNQSELISLNVNQNWRFYFSCEINHEFYFSYFDFSQIYSMDADLNMHEFSLMVKYTDSDLKLERKFNISNNKFGSFACHNSNWTVNNSLECTGFFISQKENDLFLLNKGDCQSQVIGSSGIFFDGFGPNNYDHDSKYLNSSINAGDHFLLTDTHIKIETDLIGFEFFSIENGTFTINLWKFDECMKTCALAYSQNLTPRNNSNVFQSMKITFYLIYNQIVNSVKPEFPSFLDKTGLPIDVHKPQKFFRYEIIKLQVDFTLNFIQKHTMNKSWTIYPALSASSFSSIPILLENNPTVNKSQLVILSNTLPYGVYKLVHWIYVKIDTGYLTDLENEITHLVDLYIELVPGGIAIFCLENGLDFIRLGQKQTLELNPLRYAYDIDFLVQPDSLDYNFFCTVIDKSNSVDKLEHIDLIKSDNLKEFYLSQNNSSPLKNKCFNSSEDFYFSGNGKILTIKNNTLESFEDKINLFIVTTKHLGKEYFQFVRVEKMEADEVPVASITCRLKEFCKTYGKYTRINSAYQLVLLSDCTDGCNSAQQVVYTHKLFFRSDESSEWTMANRTLLESCTLGEHDQEFTILSKIFDLVKNALFWKVDVDITTVFENKNSSAIGSTSLFLKINEKPFNGSCRLNTHSGFALHTFFAIQCKDWLDNDGYVIRYEYFAQYSDGSSPIALSYNQNGLLVTQLPQGLYSDGYKMHLFVQIIDDSDAITIYEIENPVVVEVRQDILLGLTNQLVNDPENSEFFKQIKSGDLHQASANIISMSLLLREQTENAENNQKIKDLFIQVADDFKVGDLSSLKLVSSVMSTLSENSDEMTEFSARKASAKTLQLSQKLNELASSHGFEFLKQAADKIVDSAANVLLSVDNLKSDNILDTYQSTSSVLDSLVNVSSLHLSMNHETEIKSKSIQVKIGRISAEQVANKNLSLEAGQFTLPQLNVTNSVLMIRGFSMPRIIANKNPLLNNSKVVSLSIFDQQNQEININNSNFRIKIKRDQNESHFKNFTPNSQEKFAIIQVDLADSNSTINLQVKPANDSSYIVLVGFGSRPSFESFTYDQIEILCQHDLNLDSYQISLNANTIKKFLAKKYFSKIFFGLSEIGDDLIHYCANGTLDAAFLNSTTKNLTLKNDFFYRVYSSECFYFDTRLAAWISDGLEVVDKETGIFETSCRSTHLTDFAGSFLVLPTEIDFQSVFANSSFSQNPTIYITVIVVCSAYILMSIVCLYMDRKDKAKNKVLFLKDNSSHWNYFYEINVFTGSRKNAGTKSSVKVNLYGMNSESFVRELKSGDQKENKNLFQRSSMDTFIMGVERPLGSLFYCRVFHDNSAKNRHDSSWYLKHLIVTDLQTNEKYVFICEKWFSLDSDDGKIDRQLSVAGEEELKNLSYLIKRGTKDKLSDGHLWVSIVAKPSLSSFTRLDRLTCAFVLLFISMLANILYYEADTTPKSGDFTITPQQIGIGIMTNLICFPPSFLLIQLFRRSKSRPSKVDEPRKNTKKDKKKKLEFPWWVKIIAYFLSIVFSAVSLFLIIVKGISLGDDKVAKWLSSFVFSILTSFVITQPIQVAAITFLLVLIFRKAEDFTNFEDSSQFNEQNGHADDKTGPTVLTDLASTKPKNLNEVRERFQRDKKAMNILKEITHIKPRNGKK